MARLSSPPTPLQAATTTSNLLDSWRTIHISEHRAEQSLLVVSCDTQTIFSPIHGFFMVGSRWMDFSRARTMVESVVENRRAFSVGRVSFFYGGIRFSMVG